MIVVPIDNKHLNAADATVEAEFAGVKMGKYDKVIDGAAKFVWMDR